MHAAAIIVFREVLEVALVVSIVLAASRGIELMQVANCIRVTPFVDIDNAVDVWGDLRQRCSERFLVIQLGGPSNGLFRSEY